MFSDFSLFFSRYLNASAKEIRNITMPIKSSGAGLVIKSIIKANKNGKEHIIAIQDIVFKSVFMNFKAVTSFLYFLILCVIQNSEIILILVRSVPFGNQGNGPFAQWNTPDIENIRSAVHLVSEALQQIY